MNGMSLSTMARPWYQPPKDRPMKYTAKPPSTNQKWAEIIYGYGHSHFMTRGMMK